MHINCLPAGQPSSDWLQQIDQLIQQQLHNPQLNIQQLALQLHLSERQLYRKVRKETGKTPGEYLREQRLLKSWELLHQGKKETVAEIAYAVGFETPSYFTKVFKKKYGFRPSSRL